jgi:arsenate reductase
MWTEPLSAPRARRRLLVVCAGNAVRSQLAEALVNHFFGDQWEAYSAGTAPLGYVHPLVLQVLEEWGMEVRSLRSKAVAEFDGQPFDLVIAIAEGTEPAPAWQGPARLRRVWLPDPARVRGTAAERLDAFRQARNSIWHAVREHLHAIPRESDSALVRR